jgi:hypothetical protein
MARGTDCACFPLVSTTWFALGAGCWWFKSTHPDPEKTIELLIGVRGRSDVPALNWYLANLDRLGRPLAPMPPDVHCVVKDTQHVDTLF